MAARYTRSRLPGFPRAGVDFPVAPRMTRSASAQRGLQFEPVPLPQNHKLLAFFPLVFIIGTEGFAMFAPYVVLLLSLAHVARRLKPPSDGVPVVA